MSTFIRMRVKKQLIYMYMYMCGIMHNFLYLINERADEFGFKYVAKRNPVEKSHQSVQSSSD